MGLVAPEPIDAECLSHLVGEWSCEVGGPGRTGGDALDVDEARVGGERRHEGVGSWLGEERHLVMLGEHPYDRGRDAGGRPRCGTVCEPGRPLSTAVRSSGSVLTLLVGSTLEPLVLFDVTVTPADSDPRVAVVAIVGELDVATAPRLRQELVGLSARGPHRLVIDLGGVDFLDSTGVGVLLGAVRRARTGDGRLALANAEPQVARVFEVTRLIDILPLHDSVEAAARSLVED